MPNRKTKQTTPAIERDMKGQAERLNIVFRDLKRAGTVKYKREFGDILNTYETSMSKMMNGQILVSKRVYDAITIKLGYNADWFLNGTGEKKNDPDKKQSTLTEVQMLREEITLLRADVKRYVARTVGLEKDIETLKATVKELRKVYH